MLGLEASHNWLMCLSDHVGAAGAAGHVNGKADAAYGEEDAKIVPPSLKNMVAPLKANETEAAKAVWTGTPVDPIPAEQS